MALGRRSNRLCLGSFFFLLNVLPGAGVAQPDPFLSVNIASHKKHHYYMAWLVETQISGSVEAALRGGWGLAFSSCLPSRGSSGQGDVIPAEARE